MQERYPRWGKDKLAIVLKREGFPLSVSMIGRILRDCKRRGLLVEAPATTLRPHSRHARPYAVRKPKEYHPQQPGDPVPVDTMHLTPLPGVERRHFSAGDVVSRFSVCAVRAVFCRANQRDGFRQYLAGLLLPAERTKTLTALANVEPVVGAQAPAAQRLQWFLSESTWDAAAVTARRLEILRADPATALHAGGVLIVDETGDRKDGEKTAHVGRQYLGNRGKTEQGVVSVGSLWADEGVYYPLAVEPYTPKHWFPLGKADPAFRTKPQIALALVDQAVAAGVAAAGGGGRQLLRRARRLHQWGDPTRRALRSGPQALA